jgi:hypothetical protein
MLILQIEHPVPDFDAWKKAFDSDPINREQSGVRRYRVSRQVDNPNYVIIDLEFDNLKDAEAVHTVLQKLWNRVEGKVMMNPRSRIIETVDIKEY